RVNGSRLGASEKTSGYTLPAARIHLARSGRCALVLRRRSCTLCSLLVTRGARPPCEPVKRKASCAASRVCGWHKPWCARVRVKLREFLQHEEYVHTRGLPRNTACGPREPQECSWEYFFLHFSETSAKEQTRRRSLRKCGLGNTLRTSNRTVMRLCV
ncbi:unnamed protein product, partial [Ixodes persulcatus]